MSTFAEYTVADLDLSEESPIVSSRAYRQRRDSLAGTQFLVKFFSSETPWAGGTTLTLQQARTAVSGPAYVAPPTAEEIAEEAKAMSDYREQQLLRLAEHKMKTLAAGTPLEGMALASIKAACLEVQGGGTNAIVDELVRLYGANETNTINKTLQTISNAEERAEAVQVLVLAGRRANDRDEDVQPFIDELRAL